MRKFKKRMLKIERAIEVMILPFWVLLTLIVMVTAAIDDAFDNRTALFSLLIIPICGIISMIVFLVIAGGLRLITLVALLFRTNGKYRTPTKQQRLMR